MTHNIEELVEVAREHRTGRRDSDGGRTFIESVTNAGGGIGGVGGVGSPCYTVKCIVGTGSCLSPEVKKARLSPVPMDTLARQRRGESSRRPSLLSLFHAPKRALPLKHNVHAGETESQQEHLEHCATARSVQADDREGREPWTCHHETLQKGERKGLVASNSLHFGIQTTHGGRKESRHDTLLGAPISRGHCRITRGPCMGCNTTICHQLGEKREAIQHEMRAKRTP